MRSFTIVTRPNYQDLNTQKQWNYFFPPDDEKSLRTRLRAAPQDPLKEALKALIQESDGSLKLIHPGSPNLSTVCVWEQKEKKNKYYVKSSNDLMAFDRPENNNWLYLPKLQGKKLIDFRNIKDYNATYRYQVIEPEELGFPNSLASKKNSCYGVFFKQIKSDEGIAEQIIDLDSLDESQGDYHAVGCLNPLILTFLLNENDIEHIEKATENTSPSLYALSLFIDESALILVEPHIDESYDLRISFLIKLNQLIQERQDGNLNNKNLSLIEYILFGSQYPQPWKPFFILDLLGGEFYAYQKQWENQEREKTLISWKSPQDAKSNKRWLADYWLKKWVDSQLINTHTNVVPPPSLARPYRSSKGLVTFRVDDLSETNTNISLTSLLKGHPLYISDSQKNNPYHFLVELFKNHQEKDSQTFPYDKFWRMSQNNQLVKFDDVDFWNYFSKTHVVPESPILIAIPNQDNSFLNPIGSVNLGSYHFLWTLFNCFDSVREHEIVEFSNEFGWWNDWHLTIFNERWDVCLKFIEQSGFVIQKSLVGKDCLGFKANQIDWENSSMRFSRPTKNNLL